jgi:hypothetical protein
VISDKIREALRKVSIVSLRRIAASLRVVKNDADRVAPT